MGGSHLPNQDWGTSTLLGFACIVEDSFRDMDIKKQAVFSCSGDWGSVGGAAGQILL